jgi:hypothetical protein
MPEKIIHHQSLGPSTGFGAAGGCRSLDKKARPLGCPVTIVRTAALGASFSLQYILAKVSLWNAERALSEAAGFFLLRSRPWCGSRICGKPVIGAAEQGV